MKHLHIKRISVVILNILALYTQFRMAAHASWMCYLVSDKPHAVSLLDLLLSISENLFYDVQGTVVFIIFMALAVAMFVMNIVLAKKDEFSIMAFFYYPVYYFAIYLLFGYMQCLGPDMDGEGLANLLAYLLYGVTLIPIAILMSITLFVCLFTSYKEKYMAWSFTCPIAVFLITSYADYGRDYEITGYEFFSFALISVIQIILISMSTVVSTDEKHLEAECFNEKDTHYFNGVLTDKVDNIEKYFYNK